MFKKIIKGIRAFLAFIFLTGSVLWIIPTLFFFLPTVIMYSISALFESNEGFKLLKAVFKEIKQMYKSNK